MANYLTHAQLAERPGARELAQVASERHETPVAADLMAATLRGEDRSAWTAPQIAAADAALARIDEAATEADSLIDGFLVGRDYTLPLAPVPTLVTGWARAIVRYKLHQERISDPDTDPIVRDYRDALRLLALVQQGKFHLGAGDQFAAAADELHVEIQSEPTVFGRDQLKSFR